MTKDHSQILKLSPFFQIEKLRINDQDYIKKTPILMHEPQINQRLIEMIVHEFEILQMLQNQKVSPNDFFAKSIGLDGYALILEYLNGMNLKTRIKQGIINKPKISQSIISAIINLHQQNIAHLDLSPSNIMIVGDQAKLIDFANAIILNERHQRIAVPHKIFYSHPSTWDSCFEFEQTQESQYNALELLKRDHFALGLILYELWMGQRFFDISMQEVYLARSHPQQWEMLKIQALSKLQTCHINKICPKNKTIDQSALIEIIDRLIQPSNINLNEVLEFFEQVPNLGL